MSSLFVFLSDIMNVSHCVKNCRNNIGGVLSKPLLLLLINERLQPKACAFSNLFRQDQINVDDGIRIFSV